MLSYQLTNLLVLSLFCMPTSKVPGESKAWTSQRFFNANSLACCWLHILRFQLSLACLDVIYPLVSYLPKFCCFLFFYFYPIFCPWGLMHLFFYCLLGGFKKEWKQTCILICHVNWRSLFTFSFISYSHRTTSYTPAILVYSQVTEPLISYFFILGILFSFRNT